MAAYFYGTMSVEYQSKKIIQGGKDEFIRSINEERKLFDSF